MGKLPTVIIFLQCLKCDSIVLVVPKNIKYHYCGKCGAWDGNRYKKIVYKLEEGD